MNIRPVYLASTIIGSAILAFFVISWGLSHWVLEPPLPSVLKVLRHGCEGAMVGGICDFIAVRMVYDTARNKFPDLRDNTAKVVIKDMVDVQGLITDASRLKDFLTDPENQQEFVALLQDTLPNRSELEENLEEFWHTDLRSHIIEWMLDVDLKYDPNIPEERTDINLELYRKVGAKCLRYVADEEEENRQLVDNIAALSSDVSLAELGIPSDPDEVTVLLHNLWEHWEKIGLEEQGKITQILSKRLAPTAIEHLGPAIARVVSTTTIKDAIEPLLTEAVVRHVLVSTAEKIEEENLEILEENGPQIFEDFLAYLSVFWRAWQGLPDDERLSVVEESLRLAEKPILDWIRDAIWDLRTQLLTPEILLEKQVAAQLVDKVSQHILSQAEVAEEKAIGTLQKQFDDMGAEGFVSMLQSRTQEQLDWIKVNGSGWGFVLGSMAGCIELLF
jgi:hypothetical protein